MHAVPGIVNSFTADQQQHLRREPGSIGRDIDSGVVEHVFAIGQISTKSVEGGQGSEEPWTMSLVLARDPLNRVLPLSSR